MYEGHYARRLVLKNVYTCRCLCRLQVEALDLDSPPNAGITFRIGSGDRDGHFTINSEDGYIAVKGKLDRETVSEISFQCGVPCLLAEKYLSRPARLLVEYMCMYADQNKTVGTVLIKTLTKRLVTLVSMSWFGSQNNQLEFVKCRPVFKCSSCNWAWRLYFRSQE